MPLCRSAVQGAAAEAALALRGGGISARRKQQRIGAVLLEAGGGDLAKVKLWALKLGVKLAFSARCLITCICIAGTLCVCSA